MEIIFDDVKSKTTLDANLESIFFVSLIPHYSEKSIIHPTQHIWIYVGDMVMHSPYVCRIKFQALHIIMISTVRNIILPMCISTEKKLSS